MFYRLWMRLFGLDRTSNVLKNFHKTIKQLDATKKFNDAESDRHSRAIKSHEAWREVAQRESLKADAVATKLRGIVEL